MAKNSSIPDSENLGSQPIVALDDPEITQRKFYFINEIVEDKLRRYIWTACTGLSLRDSIMSHATELITQIIRKQNLHIIYPGQEESAFGDLVQTAWVQIERTLYKFRSRPHCRACYSPDRPMDSALYLPDEAEYSIITYDELFLWLGMTRKKYAKSTLAEFKGDWRHRQLPSILRRSSHKGKRTKELQELGHDCPHCGSRLDAEPAVEPTQGRFGGSLSVLFRGNSKVFNMWCVAPDTMVFADGRPVTIRRAIYDSSTSLYGLEGRSAIIASLEKPRQEALDITTECGYGICCSRRHRLYTLCDDGPRWRLAGDLVCGDLLALQVAQDDFCADDDIGRMQLSKRGTWRPPTKWSEELAYIVGLFIAEGSYSYNKLVIYTTDVEIIDRLVNNALGLNFVPEPNYQRVSLCNARFIEFLMTIGFGEHTDAQSKFIPDQLLRMSKQNLKSLIVGMFDGDGHSTKHNGCVGYTSTSPLLINQLRMLLLSFGIISKVQYDPRTERNFGAYISQLSGAIQLMLPTSSSRRFYDLIGFGLSRKQANRLHLASARDRLYGLNEKFKALYQNWGPGSLGYDSIRRVLKGRFCTPETAKSKLESWRANRDDPSYKFIVERLEEFNRGRDRIIWLPIVNITTTQTELCEVSLDSESHAYVANGIVSHNSQVARTVILAFVKKEGRDRKNSPAYREHLNTQVRIDEDRLKRFFMEAEELCKHNDDHMCCLRALQTIIREDDKPWDGIIGKLVAYSGLSRSQVTAFIKAIRLRSLDFTDSPLSQEASRDPYGRTHSHLGQEYDDY